MSDMVSSPERESRWSALTSIHAWMVLHVLLVVAVGLVLVRWSPWAATPIPEDFHVSDDGPISFDGSRLVGYTSEAAQVWSLDEVRPLARVSVPGEMITSASFSPDGSAIITTSQRGARRLRSTVRLWDSMTGDLLKSFGKPKHRDATYANTAYFSPDGGLVVAGCEPSSVWDVSTGKWLFDFDAGAYPRSFSAGGRSVAVLGRGDTVSILETGTGKEIAALEGRRLGGWPPEFSPDGRRILTVSRESTEPIGFGKARVWDAETGEELFALPGSDHYYAMYSPDGRFIVTIDKCESLDPRFLTAQASVWDSGTGERVNVLDDYCLSVSFSADGSRVAGISGQNKGSVWDLRTGKKLSSFPLVSDRLFGVLSALKGNPGLSVHLSPTGDRVVVGCTSASTVRVLRRRFPEGWTGHLYRVEVWASIVIGAAWLWMLIRFARERWRAAKEAATEGSEGANVSAPPRT